MGNDVNRTSWIDADWRTTALIIVASASAMGALMLGGGFLSLVLLAGAAYSGFKAYEAKKQEHAAIANAIASSAAAAQQVFQPSLAPEPAQQPAETKWQATVSKSTSQPSAGRGA